MAKRRGVGRSRANGAGLTAPQVPSIDELRRIYEEGIPIRTHTGVVVQIRPVQLDRLLTAGKIPDILTPLVMRLLFGSKPDDVEFPDEVKDPVSHYVFKQREEVAEAIEYMKSIDAICEAALIDPSVVPYLPIADRIWIFQLALLRAEVLSTFRHEPPRYVETVHDQQDHAQQTEPDHVPG